MSFLNKVFREILNFNRFFQSLGRFRLGVGVSFSADTPVTGKDFQRARYNEMSELQIYRRTYIPPLPTILTKDVEVKKCEALGAAGDHGSFADNMRITGR